MFAYPIYLECETVFGLRFFKSLTQNTYDITKTSKTKIEQNHKCAESTFLVTFK